MKNASIDYSLVVGCTNSVQEDPLSWLCCACSHFCTSKVPLACPVPGPSASPRRWFNFNMGNVKPRPTENVTSTADKRSHLPSAPRPRPVCSGPPLPLPLVDGPAEECVALKRAPPL